MYFKYITFLLGNIMLVEPTIKIHVNVIFNKIVQWQLAVKICVN